MVYRGGCRRRQESRDGASVVALRCPREIALEKKESWKGIVTIEPWSLEHAIDLHLARECGRAIGIIQFRPSTVRSLGPGEDQCVCPFKSTVQYVQQHYYYCCPRQSREDKVRHE